LIKDLAQKEFFDAYSDVKTLHSVIEGKFVFSLIWSFGASANTTNRKKIES
jgi:transcription elongation factor GreA-like protein